MVFGSPLFYKCIFISEKDSTELSYDGGTRATNQPSSFQVEWENHPSCRHSSVIGIYVYVLVV